MKTRKILLSLILVSILILPYSFAQAEDTTVVDTEVADITLPVITLIGEPTINIHVGDTYTDEGATATDDIDGDITASITKTGTVDTNTVGTYTIDFNVSDAASNAAPTVTRTVIVSEPIVTPTPKETILIRNGNTVVYNDSIDLPAEGNIEILDSNGVAHQVNSRSVLGVLYILDQASDTFSFSKLQYYDSFSSFYIKCMIPSGSSELCDSWQYIVGGTSPWTSVDSTMLVGGETIALYFGNPYRINLSSTSVTTLDTITAKAETYNYIDNTWSNRTGVTIGVTTPNPSDQWNPTVIATYPVDANGQATLSFTNEGSYTVGISEDYYFPSYTITVNPISSGGGGGGVVITPTFSIPNALSFLESKQNKDGSFGSELYTDWAAIAIASAGSQANNMKSLIVDYLKNNEAPSSIVTDNERHAMALMALSINPYSGTSINYISKIVSSFDGAQFGDTSLINDDIFGLIVLKNAGYGSSDEIIGKDISYIISKQSPDGSWGSIDMTAAGIQALKNFSNFSGVSESISQALNYLTNSQGSDGGFDNSFSTSWVLQAIAQGSSLSTKAEIYLATKQQTDGGLDLATDSVTNRIWSTSYAIPSILHMSWNDIMGSFNKEVGSSGASDNKATNTEEKPVEEIVFAEVKAPEDKPTEEILPKTEKPKIKAKIAKKNIKENPIIIPTEDITASNGIVAGASTSRSKFSIIISSILTTILSPFTWLLVHLGF